MLLYQYKKGKTVLDQYKDELVYNGCFSSDDSDFLKNIKKRTALSKEYIDQMIETLDHLVKSALMFIHNGEFSIDPKMIEKKSTCRYCPYGTICYKTYSDYKYIAKKGGKR